MVKLFYISSTFEYGSSETRRTSDVICCIVTSKNINACKICTIDRGAGYILDMYIKTTRLCVLI